MQHPLSRDLGLGFDTHKPRWWKRGPCVSHQITAQNPSCLNREWLSDQTHPEVAVPSYQSVSVCLSPECFWSRLTASQLFVHARSCHHPVAGSHIIINTSSCNIQGNKVGYFHSYPVFELCDWLPLHPPLHTLLCRAETCCVAVWDDCSCMGNNGRDGWITFCFLSPSVGSVRPSVTQNGGQTLKEYT